MVGFGCTTPLDVAIDVRVLSGRADTDMVSGGDALVEVTGVDDARITLNGQDVSNAFSGGHDPRIARGAGGWARRGSKHARSPG